MPKYSGWEDGPTIAFALNMNAEQILLSSADLCPVLLHDLTWLATGYGTDAKSMTFSLTRNSVAHQTPNTNENANIQPTASWSFSPTGIPVDARI